MQQPLGELLDSLMTESLHRRRVRVPSGVGGGAPAGPTCTMAAAGKQTVGGENGLEYRYWLRGYLESRAEGTGTGA